MESLLEERVMASIEKFETKAIDISDLDRAIKYNWLRNTYKQHKLTAEEAVEALLRIHADVE